jgi:hypothetical protein
MYVDDDKMEKFVASIGADAPNVPSKNSGPVKDAEAVCDGLCEAVCVDDCVCVAEMLGVNVVLPVWDCVKLGL